MEFKDFVGRTAAITTSLVAGLLGAAFSPYAGAAYNVGAALRTFTPAAAAQCGNQGGTSMALIQGSRLSGVDSVSFPILVAITCLDNSDVTKRSTIYFVDPATGDVKKTIETKIANVTAAPGNGWAHLVNRPDKGDLLACGNNGLIYSIDYNQFNTTADGTATLLPRPAGLSTSCGALAWDPEEDMIYQGLVTGSGQIDVAKFKDGTTTLLATVNTPCTPSGLAVTGGVLVIACDGVSTILRADKNTGAILAVNGTLGVLGLPSGTKINPDLGDLACDPTTFAGEYKDAMWSRNGVNGNGVVALEFPAFTCGLPSNATVLSAGLSAPGPSGPGELPKASCFGTDGKVLDADGDGLPDCWETEGIDFDGNGVVDLQLCVQVDTNGDGIVDATECANPNRKDIFVEIDWMQFHKPDPQALSQTQLATSVGVKSVREAFAAAPVKNPSDANPTGPDGISIHFQVNEQVSFMTLSGTGPVSHVNEIAFTPCTGPGSFAISQSNAADFDAIKKLNFGTAAERAAGANTLNAKRLAFRYVLFAHKQIGGSAQAGSNSSGCAEVAGDDAVITLGGFAGTLVDSVIHNRGTADQQSGTLLHELGHTLGLRHGGGDGDNCKPNYLSVMSYTRQFAGSPITNRRLDFSRAKLPNLDENAPNESAGLGGDPSLQPLMPFFPAADQTTFGPTTWSVTSATSAPINWDKTTTSPTLSADLNFGTSMGCTPAGKTTLAGFNDWANLVYRASTALDFAGGVRSDTPQELTREQEEALFLAGDLDGNGFADGNDCGNPSFECTHRIDIKPSAPLPKFISLGKEANVTIAIFSEASGSFVWDAPAQVGAQVPTSSTLIFSVGPLVFPVKLNHNGAGTCSVSDVEDPVTLQKDGIKDLKCQFPTNGIPLGTHVGILSGSFLQDGQLRAFRARQEFTAIP